jgi:hypothetical protein
VKQAEQAAAKATAFHQWKEEGERMREELGLTSSQWQRAHDFLLKPPVYQIGGETVSVCVLKIYMLSIIQLTALTIIR